MMQDFKNFVMRGNVMDMAVGIIIGAAFGLVIKTLVSDVIMPPIGLLLGGVDFANIFTVVKEGAVPAAQLATLEAAKESGAVTINWGVWINTIISFLIVAFAVFMMVRSLENARKKEEEKPAPPPAPSDEVKLLTEIRDALKK